MELEVNTEVNLLGNNLTENNINILKKVAPVSENVGLDLSNITKKIKKNPR